VRGGVIHGRSSAMRQKRAVRRADDHALLGFFRLCWISALIAWLTRRFYVPQRADPAPAEEAKKAWSSARELALFCRHRRCFGRVLRRHALATSAGRDFFGRRLRRSSNAYVLWLLPDSCCGLILGLPRIRSTAWMWGEERAGGGGALLHQSCVHGDRVLLIRRSGVRFASSCSSSYEHPL